MTKLLVGVIQAVEGLASLFKSLNKFFKLNNLIDSQIYNKMFLDLFCNLMVIARGNLFVGKNTNYIKFLIANTDTVIVCTAFGQHADDFASKIQTGQVITITDPQIQAPNFGLVNCLIFFYF